MWPLLLHSSSPLREVPTEPIVSVSGVPPVCIAATQWRQQLALTHHPSPSDGGFITKRCSTSSTGLEEERKLHLPLNHCFTAGPHCTAICTAEQTLQTSKIDLRARLIQKHQSVCGGYDLAISPFHKLITAFSEIVQIQGNTMNCDSHNIRNAATNFKCFCSAALEQNLFKCKLSEQVITQCQDTLDNYSK